MPIGTGSPARRCIRGAEPRGFGGSPVEPRRNPANPHRVPDAPHAPVRLLLRTLAHPVASFHPRRMPLFARRSYAYELSAVFFVSVALAMVDGALTGVIVNKAFDGI